MKNALAIFAFLRAATCRGERTALVTITRVEGSSSRAPGTHIAVSETGRWCGSLSSGCIEAAVVGEACRVIRAGITEELRFGAGSPFIDIRLPCGGAVDLLVLPQPDSHVLELARFHLDQRHSVTLAISRAGGLCVEAGKGGPSQWRDNKFLAVHEPDLKLVIMGHGSETIALARMARVYGALVEVLTPDRDMLAAITETGAKAWWLKTPVRSDYLDTDAETAVVTLFHDHDWETDLLAQALEQDAFYIGAMGSRTTHQNRIRNLRAMGVSESKLDRIVGPVGFIPAAREPETLALSVLGEIVAAQRAAKQTASARGST